MSNPVDSSTERWGLLANSSSRLWDIAVDELLNGEEWVLELDGPQTYLVFQLKDLKVLETALQLLESGPPSGRNCESSLTLGRFGSASVSLVWDNEDFPRCFLIVGPHPRSTLRVVLNGEDIQMLIEALREVVQDLPQLATE